MATDVVAAYDLNESNYALFLQVISTFLSVVLDLFSRLVSKSVPRVGCSLVQFAEHDLFITIAGLVAVC